MFLKMTNSEYIFDSFLLQMECTFKKVFMDDSDQKDIFVQVGLPLIEDLIIGKSGMVISIFFEQFSFQVCSSV